MGMGMSRFPDPYETRDDLSHATVFLVVLLLLLSVAAILFFGNAWLFAPVQVPSFLSSSAGAVPRSSGAPAPAEPPPFTAPTPVPPLAGVPYQPTPSGTRTATPVATATVSGKTTPTRSTATPTRATPQPAARIGNTGGDGAYLRRTPHVNDKSSIALVDNTAVTPTGAEADGDGQHWLQVRDPHGNVGWMPAQYVVR